MQLTTESLCCYKSNQIVWNRVHGSRQTSKNWSVLFNWGVTEHLFPCKDVINRCTARCFIEKNTCKSKNGAVENAFASVMSLSPHIQQGSAKGGKSIWNFTTSLLSYHHSSHYNNTFQTSQQMKLNTDEGITQCWKRVTNEVVTQNRAVFIKMSIKGEIATL